MHSQNVRHALDALAEGQAEGLADRAVLALLAEQYRWAASPNGGSADIYTQNNLHVSLVWTGDVLTDIYAGTRVSGVTASGGRYSAAEMSQLAAMFLSDTE